MYSVKLNVGGLDRGSLPVRATEARLRSRVCRNLFGPVDHDALRLEIESKLRELSERDQKRWNFNFSSGTPLDGEFEWEQAAETLPEFYHEAVQVGKRRVALNSRRDKKSVEVAQLENSILNEEQTHAVSAASTDAVIRSRERVRGVRRKARFASTRVTDFYRKQRITGGLKQLEKPFVSVAEQTPRKRVR